MDSKLDLFLFPKLKNTPHAARPSPYYKYMIKIVEQYKIAKEEIIRGRTKDILRRIKTPKTPTPSQLEITSYITKLNYSWIHHPIFPNYLKTFNFKIVKNLRPVEAKFKQNIPALNHNVIYVIKNTKMISTFSINVSTYSPSYNMLQPSTQRQPKITLTIS